MHAVEPREPVVVDVVGESDVELDAERRRDVLREGAADAAPLGIGPTQQLALVEAEGDGVVALARSWLPQRSLARQPDGQRLRVGEELGTDRLVERGEAGLVGEQLPDGDLLLAVLRELGPVGGHALLEVQVPAAVRHRERHGCHALGGREDRYQGVALPGQAPAPVALAAPQVHDDLAVALRRAGGPDRSALRELRAEGVGDRSEARRDVTLDLRRLYPGATRHREPPLADIVSS